MNVLGMLICSERKQYMNSLMSHSRASEQRVYVLKMQISQSTAVLLRAVHVDSLNLGLEDCRVLYGGQRECTW